MKTHHALLSLLPLILLSCSKSNTSSSSSNTLPSNYMSANINGTVISGTVHVIAYDVENPDEYYELTLSIPGTPNMQEIVIEIGADNVLNSGNYLIGEGTPGGGGTTGYYAVGPNTSNLTYYRSDPGTLVLTSETSGISGTFSFTGISAAGDSISVTDGVLNHVSL
jgi:hypothetical protein